MDKEFNIKEVLTVPNFLTFLRIVLITPFVVLFLNKQFLAAAIVIIISGLTDCIDGWVARKFNQVTELGKLLDPIADKLTLIAIVVCFIFYYPIVAPVMFVLIIKDLLMLIGGTSLLKKGITPPAAKWYGKIGTILFYFSVGVTVLFNDILKKDEMILPLILLSITAVVMIFSLIKYAILYFELLKEHKNKSNSKE